MRKQVRVHDVVFIARLNKMGQVHKLASSQLKVIYRDQNNHLIADWFPKRDLGVITTGSALIKEEIPLATSRDMIQVIPDKEME